MEDNHIAHVSESEVQFMQALHQRLEQSKSQGERFKVVEEFRDRAFEQYALCSVTVYQIALSRDLIRDNSWNKCKALETPDSGVKTRRKARALAILIGQWSLPRVLHYQWDRQGYHWLDELVKQAKRYPEWKVFVGELNRVLFQRHIDSLNTPDPATLYRIGLHHPQALVRDAASPICALDFHTLKNIDRVRVTTEDIERFLNGDYRIEIIEHLNPCDVQRLVDPHGWYTLTWDKHGMLVNLGNKVCQDKTPAALRSATRTFQIGTVDQSISKKPTTPSSLHLSPQKGQRRKELLHVPDATPATKTECHGNETPHKLASKFSKRNHQRDPPSGAAPNKRTKATNTPAPSQSADATPNREHDRGHDDDFSSDKSTVAIDETTENSDGLKYNVTCSLDDDSACFAEAKRQAKHSQKILQPTMHHSSLQISWIEGMTPTVGYDAFTAHLQDGLEIQYLTLDSHRTEEFLREHPGVWIKPILIREQSMDKGLWSLDSYLSHVADCLGPKKSLEIINPRYSEHQQLTSEAVRGLSSAPNFGTNALNMPDYLSAAEPAFLQKHSFKLLKTLAWRQMSSSGKAADITECLRFNIFGCTGAFSAPHCDILSGTYVTCVFGIKLWMWVDPNKMTAADWAEYERAGEKWIPTRAPIYGVIVRPGFTFVMPPGQRIIHAVHTVQTSAMTGGMFWDEACVVQHIHNCAYFLKNPSLTNEPTVLDFGETFTCLESLIRDSRPHLDTPALHKAILEVMRLFCKCSPPCSAQCRCRRAGRRCNWLCSGHPTGKYQECLIDQWWLLRK